jgi:glycerophosphoryl diester phosphodiesterase
MILGVPHFATRYAERLGAQCVFLNKTQITADLVSECHCRGLEIVAHVINSEPEYLLMETMGVESVVSDVPDKIVTWRSLRYKGMGFAVRE